MSKLSPFFKCIPGISGIFSILLGLAVICGWWSNNLILASILPDCVPVAFNAALIFIVLGISLFLSCRNKKRYCFLPLLVASGILALTAIEYITGKTLFIDELFFKTPHLANVLHAGRLAPNTAIAIALIVLSQTLLLKSRPNKWISFLTLFLSQFACAIGWLSLLGYALKLESTYHWLNLTPMALGTSIGIIVLSMGVLALGIKQERDGNTRFPYRYEILICSLGLFLTVSFWLTLEKQEDIQLKQLTQQRTLTLEAQLIEKISARFKALDRIAARWAYANGSSYGAWEDDVKHYLQDQPDYISIRWIDKAFHTRWIHLRDSSKLRIHQSPSIQTTLYRLLEDSRESGKSLPSPVYASSNGQKEILYISPIKNRNGEFDGFISGTYKLDELLKNVVTPDASNFKITISENEHFIYGKQADKSSPAYVEKPFTRFGLDWDLQVNPSEFLVEKVESPLANLILLTGILLSILATALVNIISRTKKQSKLLHQSESNLDSTIEYSAIGLAVVSLEGKWLRVNRSIVSMLGYSEEQLLQTTFQSITHPDDIATDLNNMDQLLLGTIDNYQMEKRYLHKNGDYIWAQLNVSLVKDTNGKAKHFIEQIQDITDRLRLEEDRNQQAMRFQAIFNQTYEFIGLLSTDGIVIEANHSALAASGIAEQDVLGKPFWETPWWAHSSTLQDRLKQAIKDANNGEFVRFEATHPTPGGRLIVVDFSLKPIMDENNQVILLVPEGRDISENREKELLLQKSEEKLVEAYTELESAYQSLETQFKERKAIEKQLLQAQKMDAIGTLTGGIAHDFNNILWMILGNTEMVLTEVEGEQFLTEILTDVYDAALRAKGLVKQLLDFSRKSESEKILFDTAPLIKESIKMLRSSIPTSIAIHTNINSESGQIFGDTNKFHQVVVNLCTNAYHAISDKGSISISTQKKYISPEDVTEFIFKKPGHFLMFEVSDTGCGMSADTLDRIFEPFFTTKEVGKGTGLGLSTVHGIIEEMEGFISVYSELEQGSSFKIFIPLAEKEQQATESSKNSLENETVSPISGCCVMVVDDEEMIRKMLKRTLEKMGLSVTTFSNGKAALDAYMENPSHFDLIITDQTMPEMAGIALARGIRKQNPKMPIILASGNASIITAEEINEVSPLKFLNKPIQISELKSLIAETLDFEVRVSKK